MSRKIDFVLAAEDFKTLSSSVNKRSDKTLGPQFQDLLQRFTVAVAEELGLPVDINFRKLCRNRLAQKHTLGRKSQSVYLEFDEWEFRYGKTESEISDMDYLDPAVELQSSDVEEQPDEPDVYVKSIDKIRHPLDGKNFRLAV